MEKARELQKTIWFLDCSQAFDCIDHNTLWKILKEIEVPDHFTYAEKPVCRSRSNRTGHGTADWFQVGKGRCQGYTLSPCLFNLYSGYVMQNAGLDGPQDGNQDCWEKYQ